ncbi:MAG: sodium:solute symporter family protein, partial [Clostridium sp.]
VIIGVAALGIALFKINIITLNIFSFMLRAAGPFAAFVLGLVITRVSKHSGIVSIIVGSIVGITWQLQGEPFGILAIIAGSAAALVAFLITNYVELKVTGKEAPRLEPKDEIK